MTRTRLALVAAVAALALIVTAAASASGSLAGTVGPGFTITLTQGGKKVTSLKAGSYTITISDQSPIHDYHLLGPGVNKTTSIAGMGTATWTVTLNKGSYTFVCDPHKTIMIGTFTVS